MAAVRSRLNVCKRLLQVDVSPEHIEASGGAADFATAIRQAGEEAMSLTSRKEVDKVVVVIDVARFGRDPATFKALRTIFCKDDVRFLDAVTRVYLVNADEALRCAWYAISSVPPGNRFADIVTVL